MDSFVQFALWMLVFAGIGAVFYLFYRWQFHIEQMKYDRPHLSLHATDYWPR